MSALPSVTLGVDPGCPGGWALLDSDGSAIDCGEGVVVNKHLSYRTAAAINRIKTWAPRRALIETFPPRPMMHVKSIAGLWAGIGAWRVVVEAAGFPVVDEVAPKSWQAMPDVAHAIRAHQAAERARPGFADLPRKQQGDRLQVAGKAGYHSAALARWPDQRGVLVGPKGGARLDPAAALWIAEYARLYS